MFTTVHANNVLDVLGRFLNMGVEPYNFVAALNCILAQRLVRVICPHCTKAVSYPDEYLVESGLNLDTWRDVTFYEGTGCFECGGTGFRGRSAIHELLDLSEQIRELILNKRPASEIRRAARDEGMTFLRESALDKARTGITTLKEINKVTFGRGLMMRANSITRRTHSPTVAPQARRPRRDREGVRSELKKRTTSCHS